MVLIGTYRTPVRGNSVTVPVHPAYTDANLPTSRLRAIWNSGYEKGDPAKASEVLWELSRLSDPPLHLALGKDAIALVRTKMTSLGGDIDMYESWSDNLVVD